MTIRAPFTSCGLLEYQHTLAASAPSVLPCAAHLHLAAELLLQHGVAVLELEGHT